MQEGKCRGDEQKQVTEAGWKSSRLEGHAGRNGEGSLKALDTRWGRKEQGTSQVTGVTGDWLRASKKIGRRRRARASGANGKLPGRFLGAGGRVWGEVRQMNQRGTGLSWRPKLNEEKVTELRWFILEVCSSGFSVFLLFEGLTQKKLSYSILRMFLATHRVIELYSWPIGNMPHKGNDVLYPCVVKRLHLLVRLRQLDTFGFCSLYDKHLQATSKKCYQHYVRNYV